MRWYLALAIFAVVLTAAPEAADARSRFSSRAVLGAATAPFRAVMRAIPGKSASKYRQRRTAVARAAARQPARAAVRTASIERAPIAAATTSGATTSGATTSGATTSGAATAGAATATEATEPIRAQRLLRAPVTVPASFNAYEEILGYALWPRDYAAQFWTRGYGDIIKAVVSPSATAPAVSGAERRTRLARAGAVNGDATGSVTMTSMCDARTEDQAGRTIERIGQTIELTELQRTHLRELRAALTEAVSRGKAACLDAMPATPAGRLKVAADGLWVMRDADILFRTPLVNFHATLTEAQKTQLSVATTVADDNVRHNSKPKAGSATAPGCGAGGNDLPVEAIEQLVRPTPEQRAGLDMLRGLSSDMSNYLAASCPPGLPPDPVARLDAVGHRLSAMLYAVMAFDQALNGFYLRLNDDQKRTFDRVGHR